MKLINVGNGHSIVAERITSILKYGARPIIRLKQNFDAAKKSIDLTGGDKVKTIIMVDDGYLYLSSINSETLQSRYEKENTN